MPPGRGQRQGPRGFHTPYSPGRAWMQGPGRFGHVNVGGAGGLGGPAGRVQSAIVSNTNQCDQHSAPVRKRYRAPWSQSWRVGLRSGLGGPPVGLGPLRVEESIRLTGAGAQWLALPPTMTARACPRTLGRVAVDVRERILGVSPYGVRVLAVWPLDSRRVAWPHLCTLPVPQWCPMVVNPCGDARPTMGFSLIGALPGLDQRRQGGRECAVRFWIQLGWGWGVTARKRCRPPCPMPSVLEEDAAGGVK